MKYPEQLDGWPMAEYSRLVTCRPHRWHVQEAGGGPLILLIHGAGGATQSWRGVFPLLAEDFRVIAIDLPGQGFSQLGNRSRCGLDAMAEDLAALSRQEGWVPELTVGHSAGAALAMRLWELGVPAGAPGQAAAIEGAPKGQIVSINGALENFGGAAGGFFSVMAKMLAANPFTASAFATTATQARAKRLIEGTGSHLDDVGIGLYQRLISDRSHVDATLAMMAQWSLDGLIRRAGKMAARTLLLTGAGDLAVAPRTSDRFAQRLPDAQVQSFSGLGHLAHEEDPGQVVETILRWARF